MRYVQTVWSRGIAYGYYRRQGVRIPLGRVGTPEFFAAYEQAHVSFEKETAGRQGGPGSFSAMVQAYFTSPEFAQKAPRTQREYRRYLGELSERFGPLPMRRLNRQAVYAIRDSYAATPRKALYMVQLLSIICQLAIDHGHLTTNPALRLRKLKQGDGHRPWHDHEIERFRQAWGLGTWERTAFELLLNTAQRGQDVAAMRRQNITADGWIWCRQEKTREFVQIPIARALQQALDAWLPHQPGDALLPGARGGAVGVDRFRHRMGDAYAAAGLHGVTTHGIRHTAATILHELGVDWETIGAITGHRGRQMVQHYTRQKRRGAAAIAKLDERNQDK